MENKMVEKDGTKLNKKQTMQVKCLPCGGYVTAELVDGSEIFPDRPNMAGMKFYRCPFCGGHVGVHPHTINPLGSIPTESVRKMRQQIHNVIDPLWKNKLIPRKVVYCRLSNVIGREFHSGECEDLGELQAVYDEALILRREVARARRRKFDRSHS